MEIFEDLREWQKGIESVKQIYLITKEGELSGDLTAICPQTLDSTPAQLTL